MNIEIKISGETTDAKFLEILVAISGISNRPATAPSVSLSTVKAIQEGIKENAAGVTMGTPTKAVPKKSVDAAPVETPKVEFAETPPDTSAPAKSKYTLEVVRAEAIAISKAGKREEVKALIATHGGEKVTDLRADVYDAFMADLAKLK